jgi:hypothetical protein
LNFSYHFYRIQTNSKF